MGLSVLTVFPEAVLLNLSPTEHIGTDDHFEVNRQLEEEVRSYIIGVRVAKRLYLRI